MDLESIKRATQNILAEAKAQASGKASARVPGVGGSAHGGVSLDVGGSLHVDQTQVLVFVAAVVIGVLVYFMLRNYQPKFVLKRVGEVMVFNQLVAILVAIAAAAVVLVAYYLYSRQ